MERQRVGHLGVPAPREGRPDEHGHPGAPAPRATAPPQEWWERLDTTWRRWAVAHPTVVHRLARLRWWCLWAGLAHLAVLLVLRSETRESVQVYAQLYWLLICWFVLTRTRTAPWRLVAGLFTVAVVWAFGVGLVLHGLADAVGGYVNAPGTSTVLAGLGEESAKLIPVALLAALAPGRVRRFAVADWLLVGFATGLGFQAAEELARRLMARVTRPSLAEVLAQLTGHGPGSGYAQYGWSPFGGWSDASGGHYAGHHVFTAAVTAVVGLSVIAWRRSRRSPGRAGLALRAAAVTAPVVTWSLAASAHAGFNATLSTGDPWSTVLDSPLPLLMRAGWLVTGYGHVFVGALPALLVVALLLDARHLYASHRGHDPDARHLDGDGHPQRVPLLDAAGQADRWMLLLDRLSSRVSPRLSARGPHRTGRVWATTTGAVCALVTTALRDVVVIGAAHAHQPGESRWHALARGRAAAVMTRQLREEALRALLTPSGSSAEQHRERCARRRVRFAALGVAALLGLVALSWAPHLAAPPSAQDDGGAWFAGILDALGRWWQGLSPSEQLALGAGVAALVVLSGGGLGVALGVSGAATYAFSHGQGAATFVRDPRAATRSYLSHTTPAGVVLDVGEGVLTFLPGNFAGAAAGGLVRHRVGEYLRDPAAFWTMLRLEGDAGAVDESLLRGSTRGAPAPVERPSPSAGSHTSNPGPTFVTTARGTVYDIPPGWVGRTADNGMGAVYQRPGATGNADMIRIMEPTPRYPDGYARIYNSRGQPVDVTGRPGPPAATHIAEGYVGDWPGWPT